MASNTFSDEEDNLMRAVYISCTTACNVTRAYFDEIHPPPQLVNNLRAEKTNLQKFRGKLFNRFEWEQLYPPAGDPQPVSTDLDINLMICLLQYMHPVIPPPPFGYDTLPHSSHTTDGAHLARIKYYMNKLIHQNESISSTDLTIIRNDLEVASIGLGGSQYVRYFKNELQMNLGSFGSMDGFLSFSQFTQGLIKLFNYGTDVPELYKMLKESSYVCYWNRIYLVGPYGVGKTTLAELLVGDPITDTRDSTDGIWIYLGRAGMDVEKRKWVFLKKGRATSAAVMSMLKTMETKTSNTDTPGEKVTLKEDVLSAGNEETNVEVEHQDSGDLPPKKNDNGHDKSLKVPMIRKVDEEILSLILEECEKGDYRTSIVPIDIWDFGGQKIYYMTHQLFISSRGTFVVVFNGSIDLNSVTNDLSFLPGRKDHNTYAGYLMHWVNSILTYCNKTTTADGIVYPRILFVATHKDKVEDVSARRKILMASLQDLFESHAGRQHLMIDQLFFINAKDENDDVLVELRQELLEVVINHPCWGERMPTKFVPLELQLLKRSDEGQKILSMHEVQTINEQNESMALTSSQLSIFLKTEHDMGKLVFFDEDHLREYVVVDPSYLIEVLRSIITQKHFWPESEHLQDIFTKLSTTGILNKSDIFELWEQTNFEHIYPYKEYMINMLIRLDIMLEPNTNFFYDEDCKQPAVETYYLVPCMITERPLQALFDKDKCIYMAYKFTEQIIPPALLYRFLASFLSMRNMNTNIDLRDLVLFTDSAVVTIDKYHKLTAHVLGNRLVVTLMHKDNKSEIVPVIAATVQESLTRNIVRTSKFYSTIANTPREKTRRFPFIVELGVDCESELCFFDHNLRLAESRRRWTCTLHKINHATQSSYLWFSDKESTRSGKCSSGCKGLEISWLQKCPSIQHIRRLGASLLHEEARKLYLYFDLSLRSSTTWGNYECEYDKRDVADMHVIALHDWTNNAANPTFGSLQEIMTKAELDPCIICEYHVVLRGRALFYEQKTGDPLTRRICTRRVRIYSNNQLIVRDIKCPLDFPMDKLSRLPSNIVLEEISHTIGSATFQLGIELGLDIVTLKDIELRHHELPDQTRKVLKVWKLEICSKNKVRYPTEALAKSLKRVGRLRSVDYLEEDLKNSEEH